MNADIINLPFGDIQVLVNNNTSTFTYQNASYNSICINDEQVYALGALEITLNPRNYSEGDVLFIRSSAGMLQSDGGGECKVNAVAELENYTYAIGGPDTEEIEWNFGNIPGDTPNARKHGYKKRTLCYEFDEISPYGLKYRIVKGVKDDSNSYANILITIAWESNAKGYAWDIVSCLTS